MLRPAPAAFAPQQSFRPALLKVKDGKLIDYESRAPPPPSCRPGLYNAQRERERERERKCYAQHAVLVEVIDLMPDQAIFCSASSQAGRRYLWGTLRLCSP